VLALPLLPRLVRAVPRGLSTAGPGSRRAALAALAPSSVLLVVTLAGGALVTFLPIERPDGALATAALVAFGITGALTRWRAGILADRVGHRLLLPAAVLVGAAGLVLVALGLQSADAVLLVGAAVFGAGFGAAQNLTLLAAFGRAGDAGTTTASALWNASFDAGTAVGALVPGLVAAAVGLPWTYAIVAAVLVVALPVARASTRLS
jgi:predicted MFS family arabinose efflux permease